MKKQTVKRGGVVGEVTSPRVFSVKVGKATLKLDEGEAKELMDVLENLIDGDYDTGDTWWGDDE